MQQKSQVGAVVVEIGRTVRTVAPMLQRNAEIGAIDDAIAVDVTEALEDRADLIVESAAGECFEHLRKIDLGDDLAEYRRHRIEVGQDDRLVETDFLNSVHEDAHFAILGSCAPRNGVCDDLDGNGIVDGADLGILLSMWGAGVDCAADLDGDGIVDGADLGARLGAWTASTQK